MALSISPTEIVEKEEHPLLSKAPWWDRVFLRDVADVQNGFPFKSSLFSVERGFPLIRIRDVGRDGTKYFYTGDYEKEFVVSRGDILIGMDGDFRAARWHGPDALLNQRVCRVFLTSEDYGEDFLFLCLQPYLNAVHSETSSVTVKHLSSKTIQDLPLPLPPLNEQRRIVAKVDAMFERVDKGVESLAAARAALGLYRQSLLRSAFEGRLTADWRARHAGELEAPETLLARIHAERDTRYKSALDAWQTALSEWRAEGEKGKKPAKPKRPGDLDPKSGITLGHVVLDVAQGWSPRCENHASPTHDVWAVIKTTAIQPAKFLPQENKQLPGSLPPREWLELNRGDVLITRAGPRTRVGVACMVKSTRPRLILCDKAYRLNYLNALILPEFLEAYLNAPDTQRRIEVIKSGINDSGLNLKQEQFLALQFWLPSLAEQAEITRILDARLDAADKMEAEIDAALSRADALRQSILKQAFAGKLVPQDPTDEPATTLLARIKAERAKRDEDRRNSRSKLPQL